MANIYLRKEGNVCTLFLDQTGQSIPFDSVEDAPEGVASMFQTMSYAEAQANFRGHTVHFIERKPRAEPPPAPRMDDASYRQQLANAGVPAEKIEEAIQQRQGNVIPLQPKLSEGTMKELAKVNEASDVQEKALTEFRILMAAYQGNSSLRVEVEAVGNFLLKLWPDLDLESCKPTKEKKFKL